MKAKIIGGYRFRTKNDKEAWSLTVVPEVGPNSKNIGVVARNLMTMDNLDLPAMLNKTYIIDTSNNFANSFYLVEEKR